MQIDWIAKMQAETHENKLVKINKKSILISFNQMKMTGKERKSMKTIAL